jgi:aminopeptidase YwaD
VIARRGSGGGRRVVLFAHIDTKEGTSGALDNAGGVAVLLLLAELLRDYSGALRVELVAMNGEDYYAAPGEMQWLRLNEGQLGDIVLGINLDGVGHRAGRPAYTLYGCPPELESDIREILGSRSPLVEGRPWYQSDHSLFLMNGVPALAFTSEQFTDLWSEVAHTPLDVPDIVDPRQLAVVAEALRDLLLHLAAREQAPAPGRRSFTHI